MGQVVDGAARGRELEVDQRNGDAVTKDDVLGAHVVVAHERPARRVSQRVVPGETLRVEPAGGVVQPAQQPGDRRRARCRTGSSPDRAPRGPRRRRTRGARVRPRRCRLVTTHPRIRRASPPAGRRGSNPSADSRGEGRADRRGRPGPRSRSRRRAAAQPHRHSDRPSGRMRDVCDQAIARRP